MMTRKSATLAVTVTAAALLSTALSAPAAAVETHPTPSALGAGQDTASSPIEQRYRSEPELRRLLGEPIGTETTSDGIAWQRYRFGWMYHTETTGVHEIHGAIATAFAEGGKHQTYGIPTTDEVRLRDGAYNHFGGTLATGYASIYWSPDTGAHGVWGPIRTFWSRAGWETGRLDYPTSTTAGTPDGGAVFNHFRAADNAGASVYASKETGAHSVQGAIRAHWAKLGWETSYLGLPVSDEYDVSHGKRSDFEGGYIVWDARTGRTADFRN